MVGEAGGPAAARAGGAFVWVLYRKEAGGAEADTHGGGSGMYCVLEKGGVMLCGDAVGFLFFEGSKKPPLGGPKNVRPFGKTAYGRVGLNP